MLELSYSVPPGSPIRLLCLGAHSDDIEIGCGGTVLSLLAKYPSVSARWVVFSANEERAAEARVSAEAFLGGADQKVVEVKNYHDGYFPFVGDRIKEDFEAIKRDFIPDIVFTHYRDDRHQDHRTISDLTWNTFRNHLILEYEIPKYDGDFGQPNLFVPLTQSICSRKTGILVNSFRSQGSKQWFDEQTFTSVMRLRGLEANSPTRFAESFYCRKIVVG